MCVEGRMGMALCARQGDEEEEPSFKLGINNFTMTST